MRQRKAVFVLLSIVIRTKSKQKAEVHCWTSALLSMVTIKWDESVMSEKVCKILLRPSPQAWGTASLRRICDGRCALSLATAHEQNANSRSPSCFSNKGAAQRMKRSAWRVHFYDAGLTSSPSRRHDIALVLHFSTPFRNFSRTENRKQKKHYCFAIKNKMITFAKE